MISLFIIYWTAITYILTDNKALFVTYATAISFCDGDRTEGDRSVSMYVCMSVVAKNSLQ